MTPTERLFDPSNAFSSPVTIAVTLGAVVLLAASAVILACWLAQEKLSIRCAERISAPHSARGRSFSPPCSDRSCLARPGSSWRRARSPSWRTASSRARRALRERLTSLVVVLGILLTTFAVLDHWSTSSSPSGR